MDFKKLLKYILGTIFIGSFFSLFIFDSFKIYEGYEKPFLSPPGIVFPIVWTILYILMGVSLYLVMKKRKDEKSFIIYISQLLLNSIWPLFFFKFRFLFFSFLIIVALIILVIKMITEFYKINKTAGLLQIPYLLWLLFASYLNLAIYLLNK